MKMNYNFNYKFHSPISDISYNKLNFLGYRKIVAKWNWI